MKDFPTFISVTVHRATPSNAVAGRHSWQSRGLRVKEVIVYCLDQWEASEGVDEWCTIAQPLSYDNCQVDIELEQGHPEPYGYTVSHLAQPCTQLSCLYLP